MLLRHVLEEFETAQGAISLTELSRKLGVNPKLLATMLDFWVRQGRLQDNYQLTGQLECASGCSAKNCSSCTFIAKMPRAYMPTSQPPKPEEKR